MRQATLEGDTQAWASCSSQYVREAVRNVNEAMFNLLDSHDVPRALHMLQGDLAALKLALVLLFALPGAPLFTLTHLRCSSKLHATRKHNRKGRHGRNKRI